jgi:hypothetical protein
MAWCRLTGMKDPREKQREVRFPPEMALLSISDDGGPGDVPGPHGVWNLALRLAKGADPSVRFGGVEGGYDLAEVARALVFVARILEHCSGVGGMPDDPWLLAKRILPLSGFSVSDEYVCTNCGEVSRAELLFRASRDQGSCICPGCSSRSTLELAPEPPEVSPEISGWF